MKRFPALLILGLVWACSTPQREAATRIVSDEVRSRIDSELKAFVDEGRVAGASALIYEKNEEVYYNAFGYADKENQVPMDRNTIVRIYSMTKPITGVALMKLYEQGKFDLDDPLEKYAPEFANLQVCTGADEKGNLILEPPKRPVTIRDITRHTAGFINNQPIPALQKLAEEAQVMNPENTLQQMAEKLGKLPLMFHPGEQWSYGLCVDVQAFLVERLSGQPFDKFLQENILGPLNMTNTRYVIPEQDMGRFAALYRKEDGVLNRAPDEMANAFNTKDWALKPGGYGLTSTLDDYMSFAQMLVNEGKGKNGSVLKEETVKLMATNHLSDSVTERMWLPSKGSVGFGIDFAVRLRPPANEEENHGIVGEFFWDGAASTLFWVDPVNELTAVLFVQIMPFDRQVHKRFRDAIYGPYKADANVSAMGH
jgi:CubicO group peptidase (beta-lactamase class C family)